MQVNVFGSQCPGASKQGDRPCHARCHAHLSQAAAASPLNVATSRCNSEILRCVGQGSQCVQAVRDKLARGGPAQLLRLSRRRQYTATAVLQEAASCMALQ